MTELNQIIYFVSITFGILMISDVHIYVISTFFPKNNILLYENIFSKIKTQINSEQMKQIKFNDDYFTYLKKKEKSMLLIFIPTFVILISTFIGVIIFCTIKLTQNNAFVQNNSYLLFFFLCFGHLKLYS